ncbi:MAG: AmmeMemoRadiSam system radical SAM enzyme [Nitrospinae bacterium]|nr:AmmeMemoRadiSam system radical SAM enzyme [Nitrospinota bacterium]
MVEAIHYERLEGGKIRCGLCPQECVLAEGKSGICRGKKNIGGKLFAVNYGLAVSLALDPIEKKPLYHFFPGTSILSTGPNGCNFRCRFCQNWNISQGVAAVREISPGELAEEALRLKSIGLAYTYSEPFIWYEYVLEASREVRKLGMKNVLVTNGFVNEKPLRGLLPYIDAMNVDIKSMEDSFYKSLCSGRLEPVLRTVRIAHEEGCHVEITNLVIPTFNDSDGNFHELAEWIAGLDPDIPLHLSRYFPHYKLAVAPTPVETLARGRSIAMEKLNYVYVGNVSHEEWGDTFCPKCRNAVIKRHGYSVDRSNFRDGKCCICGAYLPILEAP